MNPVKSMVLLAAITMLSACATNGNNAPSKAAQQLTPEEVVTQRINERWKLIIDGDYKSAYEYLTPGTREVMSYANYEMRLSYAQIKWVDSAVNKITCDDDACEALVHLDVVISVPGVGRGPTPSISVVTERWLKSGKQWYFLPERIR